MNFERKMEHGDDVKELIENFAFLLYKKERGENLLPDEGENLNRYNANYGHYKEKALSFAMTHSEHFEERLHRGNMDIAA